MESPSASSLRKMRTASPDHAESPGLFTIDAFLNKKSTPRAGRPRTSSASDISTPIEENKNSAASKFKSIGRKVSSATNSIDRFAKATKEKLNKKLNKTESTDARGDDAECPSPHASAEKGFEPGTDICVSPINLHQVTSANLVDPEAVSTPPVHMRPFSADVTDSAKKSPLKIDRKSFKVLGEKISHVAKSTGKKMSQLGSEIEHGVSKIGHQLHLNEGSDDRTTSASHQPDTIQSCDRSIPHEIESSDLHSPSKGNITFSRMQRRVSDVLEIDKTNTDDNAELYIYDPGAEEYVSKISTMEHMFQDSAGPGVDLSVPSTNKTIGK